MADHIFLLNLSCWHWSCEAEAVSMYSDYQLHALMLVFPCFVVCSRVWEPITVLMVRIKNRYYPQLKQCCGQDLSTGFFLSSQDLNLQSCRKWCDLGLFFSAASLHRLTREATWGTWMSPQAYMPVRPGPIFGLVLPVRLIAASCQLATWYTCKTRDEMTYLSNCLRPLIFFFFLP